MSLGAVNRRIGLRHAATGFEGGFAFTALVLVHGHVFSIGPAGILERMGNELHPSHGTVLEADTEITPQTGDPVVAHIVKTEPGESAQAKVLEARIYGTQLEALCGHVWIPSRDPKQLPMCEKCKEIYEVYKAFNDGLNDKPND